VSGHHRPQRGDQAAGRQFPPPVIALLDGEPVSYGDYWSLSHTQPATRHARREPRMSV
jgi:hypothetical protein